MNDTPEPSPAPETGADTAAETAGTAGPGAGFKGAQPPLAWEQQPVTIEPYRMLLGLMVANDQPCRAPMCGVSMIRHLTGDVPPHLVDLIRAEDPDQPDFPAVDSNLVQHAIDEMARTDNDPWYVESVIAAVRGFAAGRHSGGSAFMAIDQLTRLLRMENLTPLTDDPAEWQDRSVESGFPLWQSTRNASAFSEDGGKTFSIIGDTYRHVAEPRPSVEPEHP